MLKGLNMPFTWGEQVINEREEAIADQKAEYMQEYYREHVTADKIQDALTEVWSDDDFVASLVDDFKSEDNEELGLKLLAYLEKALKDDAEDHAEKASNDYIERVRGVM